jgi:hypothetical protein
MSGEDGRSQEYRRHVSEQSPEWRAIRERARERSNSRCDSCGARNRWLECAHFTYDRLGKEAPLDVAMLCRYCHDQHDLGNDWDKWMVEVGVHRTRALEEANRQLVSYAGLLARVIRQYAEAVGTAYSPLDASQIDDEGAAS